MSELRKLIRLSNKYFFMTFRNPEKVKKEPNKYRLLVKILQDRINKFIDEKGDELYIWCDRSVTVWNMKQDKFFYRLKRLICMIYVNHFLNKLSGELARAGILQRNISQTLERITQFDLLL